MTPGMNSGGMGHAERRGPRSTDAQLAAAKAKAKVKRSERFRELWPDIKEMILPRRGIFAMGFVLMVINRVSALVLPLSTKPLIDRVINQRHAELLAPLVGYVLGATLLQGITSFSLTQLLSKAGQR